MGTLGYMAPEQVRGEPVDHRTDIFAFGAVLHEMISGTPAFRRDSRIATANAVLESDRPSWPTPWPRRFDESSSGASRRRLTSGSNPPAIPRLRSTRSPTGTRARPRPGPRGAPARVDWRSAAIAALVAALAGTVAWIVRTPAPAPPAQVRRFLIAPPLGAIVTNLAVSPDGRHLVMAASPNPSAPGRRLYLRSFDNLEARELPGTESAQPSLLLTRRGLGRLRSRRAS